MKYIQLDETICKEETDQFICKVANTVDEAKKYIEQGFTYVCNVDGAKLFRKPK